MEEPSPTKPIPREFPNVAPDCRAQKIPGVQDFAKCCTHVIDHCPHQRYVGTEILCRHPLWNKIVEQTPKSQ